MKARFAILPLALALLATGSIGSSSGAETVGALARAYAIRVVVPGSAGTATPTISSPPSDAVAPGSAFSYSGPEGVAVTADSYVASVQSDSKSNPFANASAEVTNLSLFGGEVTAGDVVARSKSSAGPGKATGDLSGTGVSGLVFDGQPLNAVGRVALADWGYADVGAQTAAPAARSFRGSVVALDVHLIADHGGLPAGTEIQVGYAETSVQAPAAPPPTKPAKKTQGAKDQTAAPKKAPEPKKPVPGVPQSSLPTRLPPDIHPRLSETPGGYVFPVYGPSSYADTFRAFRGDVPGGWHHGDDIFAPLGAPVIAVAKGTVFSVGWNDLGGNRLWLRDEQGNQFYYAHLSAYTPLAVNNAHVSAGAVLGFVGNTGDASGTPYHLHFEIHPVGLLGLGYDGVVDPTSYLDAWKHLQDLRFGTAAGWAPASSGSAPQPGAVLLQSSDISTASGLEPGSLARALRVAAVEGAAGLLGSGIQPQHGRVVEFASPRPRVD